MAEYDSFLEESAGGILGPLAGLAEGALFLSKFDFILPKLVKKLVGHMTSHRKILFLLPPSPPSPRMVSMLLRQTNHLSLVHLERYDAIL